MSTPDDFQQDPLRLDEDMPGAPIEKMAGGRRRPLDVLPMSQQAGRANDFARMPPQAVEVEQALLGAMLVDAAALTTAVALLTPDQFYDPRHARIFDAAHDLFSAGRPVDQLTISEALRARGEYERIGAAYLTELTGRVASTTNTEYHAQILADKAMRRRLITTMTSVVGKAFDDTEDLSALLDEAGKGVNDISFGVGGVRADVHIRHAAAAALLRVDDWREGKATDFAPSGIWSLDKRNGGFPRSELITLAAFSGMGKTALLGFCVANVANGEVSRAAAAGVDPSPAVVFSAEMTAEQLVHRMASQRTGLDLNHLRSGDATEAEFRAYETALGEIATLPIHIDDEPAPTFTHIASRLEQVRQTSPSGTLALVAVDYDEKVDPNDAQARTEELRVSAIARGLKNTAKRFRCPVLALKQYKKVQNPWTRLPDDEWLRYSGKTEQESAMIVHWVWPEYWVRKGVVTAEAAADGAVAGYKRDRPERGFLVVTKARHGGPGSIPLDFTPETVSFRDPAEPGRRYTPAELARRRTSDPAAAQTDIYGPPGGSRGADDIPPSDPDF